MRRRMWISCLLIAFPLFTAPARADLTLFLQDTTVAQGGYGEMNIWIGSNTVFNQIDPPCFNRSLARI